MSTPPRLVRIDLNTLEETPVDMPAQDRRSSPTRAGAIGTPFPIKRAAHLPVPDRTGELPVLHAFQEYLESERRRARLRLTSLAAVFLLVLIAIAGLGSIAGLTYMNRVNDDIWQLAQNVSAWQEASLASGASSTEFLSELQRDATEMKTAIEDARLFSAKARLEQTDVIQAYAERLTGMQGVIDALRADNEMLKSNIATLAAGIPDITAAIESLETELIILKAPRLRGMNESSSVADQTIVMPVFSMERGGMVPLRMPIPE